VTRIARFVTDFADQAVLLPLAIAVAVAFAIAGWWRGAVAWTTAVGATLGVMLLLKLAFLACGPLLPSMDVSPSGHTAAAGVVYGGLLAIMARYVTGQGRWTLPLAAGVTAIVGVSRLALGVHTVLDVGIGGTMAVAKLAGPSLPDVGPKLQAITALALPVLVVFHGFHMPAEAAIQELAFRVWPLSVCR
jgi:membrane-associated phospholipid phosphatase